jgi:hypothetical protein
MEARYLRNIVLRHLNESRRDHRVWISDMVLQPT